MKKHRHDGPDVVHGTLTQEKTTGLLQTVLLLVILGTAGLILYTLLIANTDVSASVINAQTSLLSSL